jgi:uncharacterized protein
MKKLLLATVFMLVAQLGTAQVSDAFKADVKKLLEISGSVGQMQAVKNQIVTMIAVEKQADFNKDFDASLAPLLKAQEDFYTKEFTHDEIKQMIKFYESPVGKKYVSKMQSMDEAITEVSQEWGMQIEQLVMKYRE